MIDIPNITENYINSHVFTCRHWVSANTSRCWEVFLIGQIFFYLGGLGANRNVSGKLSMKLAIIQKEDKVIIKTAVLQVYGLGWHT